MADNNETADSERNGDFDKEEKTANFSSENPKSDTLRVSIDLANYRQL